MITVGLKVGNIRLLRKAKTQAELEGCVAMILQLVEQSETLKSFGKEVKPSSKFTWREAKELCDTVLGAENVTTPPYPDGAWFRRHHYVMQRECWTPEQITELAEYVKANMRLPISFDFMLSQGRRILAGEWNRKPDGTRPSTANWRQDTLPDD